MATFSEQAEVYLAAIAARKRNPVKPTSIATFRSLLGIARPLLGSTKLEDIRSGALKQLVTILCDQNYSPNTIQSLLTLIKMVVASDVDENGEPKHLRKWNHDFIDAPRVESKKAILPTQAQIQKALAVLKSPMREFFVTQLATGCRKGELQALKVGDFDATAGLLRVSRTLSRFGETETKTKAGKREVDIAPAIVEMLAAMVGERKTGRLFDVTIDQIQWAYEKLGIKSHSLRHFRYTHLQAFKIHPVIHNYWLGHSMNGMASIYGHIHEDRELRQRLVREVALGFPLPAIAAPHRSAPERQEAVAAVSA
jgi:integrase